MDANQEINEIEKYTEVLNLYCHVIFHEYRSDNYIMKVFKNLINTKFKEEIVKAAKHELEQRKKHLLDNVLTKQIEKTKELIKHFQSISIYKEVSYDMKIANQEIHNEIDEELCKLEKDWIKKKIDELTLQLNEMEAQQCLAKNK
jgi:hypothetical protein